MANDSEKSRPFQIEGADGRPINVPAGEYYFNPKARCRRMMLNSLSSDARRIYACLELGTMGFQREDAVVMTKNGQRPMTPADVCQMTGLSKRNESRGFEELAAAGLAERRGVDGGPLQKGKVRLYSWWEPRQPKNEFGGRARPPFPDWAPESWEAFPIVKALVRRWKLDLLPDLGAARAPILKEIAAAARDYQKAEKGIRALLERVSAPKKPAGINKVERTERTSERTAPAAPETIEEPSRPPSPPLKPPERRKPQTQTYAARGGAAAPAVAFEPQTADPDSELMPILTVMGQFGPVDIEAAETLLKDCRKRAPDITPEEVAQFYRAKVDAKFRTRAGCDNPIGFALRTVPGFINHMNLSRLRREAAARAQKQR